VYLGPVEEPAGPSPVSSARHETYESISKVYRLSIQISRKALSAQWQRTLTFSQQNKGQDISPLGVLEGCRGFPQSLLSPIGAARRRHVDHAALKSQENFQDDSLERDTPLDEAMIEDPERIVEDFLHELGH
jgi:hypothetical protein